MNVGKAIGIVGGALGIIVFVATIVTAYNRLDNRLDNVQKEIAGIEKTLGSAACNAILTRQIDAIERNRTKAREALEALSKQYECGPERIRDVSASWTVDFGNAMHASENTLGSQLNAVDVLLNEEN